MFLNRFFSLCFSRFVNVLVYYGLSLGVSDLGVDLYLTQFMFGLVEIPARSLVLVLLPCSRRIPLSVFLAVGGGACLLTLAVPEGDQSNETTATHISIHILFILAFKVRIMFHIILC